MSGAAEPFDVAVIGAGVVGAAIARSLARYRLRCVLIDAAEDVGTGTSKANTAILHTGFDAKPGSLEARLVRRGHALLTSYGPQAGIPIERVGALLVAWDAEQLASLPSIAANAARNGYTAIGTVSAEELYRREPHLGAGALGALEVPDESIICPFTTPLAFATEAVVNGVDLALASPVQSIAVDAAGAHSLVTPERTFRSRYVVNAAGLYADAIDRMFGHQTFTVTPRRGELIIFDKLSRSLINHILLPVPTKVSKGVLVSPTVFGNVVLGPTAEDVADKSATGSTAAGIANLCEKGSRIVPALMAEEVTAVYAGLRAATEHSDYQLTFHPTQHYVCVGGIRSTGLSASMAIAEHVVAGLADAGLALELKDDFHSVRMPNIGEAFQRPYQSGEMIATNPDYGRIMCHCERVTRGEIVDAVHAPIPARSLDGVRRRTRALFGRCQGFFCAAAVARVLADQTRQSIAAILGLNDTGVK
ncbi:MAG TPA: NAD(P)/FAD-dependent oxidoreductase [Candidatus Acidoferrales bacterium]|nr:NAD(P)/FAD-dependent oxidoreductase [Candidatus Acidoferrales bacterium]